MISVNAFGRRAAARTAALGLATVSILAACDTDSPLEPKATAVDVPAPQAAVVPVTGGTLAWKLVRGGSGTALAGATFQVAGARFLRTVADNGTNDGDAAIGKFKLAGLQPGGYTVCEIVAPTGFALATPTCQQMTVNTNTTSSTTFVNWSLPLAMVDFLDMQSHLVGGGAIAVKAGGPAGTVLMSVIDNSASDQNKTSGKFQVQLPGAGTYSICVAFPPPGYQFVPPYTVCQTYYFNLGMSVGFGHYRVQAIN